MKRTRLSSFIAAAALALAFSSCAEGPVGIFASIAAETDINEHATDEFRGTSPSFVAKLNDGSEWYYYTGIGSLYRRSIGATSWSKAKTPSIGSGNLAAISGAVLDNYLYVLFVDISTKTKLGIYRTDDGEIWSAFNTGITNINELSHLMTAGPTIFAVTAKVTEIDGDKSTTHSVFNSDGTVSFSGLSTMDDIAVGLPNAVVYDSTNYYISAGTKTFAGSANAPVESIRTVQLGGVVSTGSSQNYFAGRDGRIYNSINWSASPAYEDYNDRPYSFSIPVVVNAPNSISTLLVPSRAYPQGSVRDQGLGYLEFNATGFTATTPPIADKSRRVSTLNNYFITLDGKSVKQILAFDENATPLTHERLFALTDGDGLWSNQWQGGSWLGWRRE